MQRLIADAHLHAQPMFLFLSPKMHSRCSLVLETMQKTRAAHTQGDEAVQPSKKARHTATLFDEALIRTSWAHPRPVGAGLHNLGNTCYMNSVLQAITHVPAFAELCLRPESLPSNERKNHGVTPYIQFHVRKALSCTGAQEGVASRLRPPAPFPPKNLVGSLRAINRGYASCHATHADWSMFHMRQSGGMQQTCHNCSPQA